MRRNTFFGSMAQDLLSAPTFQAYMERTMFLICGELTTGKKNRLSMALENRILLIMNTKYYR